MRFPHFAWYPFADIDEHLYTIQQFFRTQQWITMKQRFQKQLPELLHVLSTGNVWVTINKLSIKFPDTDKEWSNVMIVHKLRKQKLQDYLLPYKEKLLLCDTTISPQLSDRDALYLLVCALDLSTNAEFQFSWKWMDKEAITIHTKEVLTTTLNKSPSALELQYASNNKWNTSIKKNVPWKKWWGTMRDLQTLFWSWSIQSWKTTKTHVNTEEKPVMKKLPLVWRDRYFTAWNQWFKQITWYFSEYTALSQNYKKRDMSLLVNNFTAYLSACFADITFLIDHQEPKNTLVKNSSYYWLKTEIESMDRFRKIDHHQMIEAKIMKQSAEMWIQQFLWALSWNTDHEGEWYGSEIGNSLEDKKDALWVQRVTVYEPYLLSLYKSYCAIGQLSGKNVKREEMMLYVQKNILHDFCTTRLKIYHLLPSKYQEMVRFWKSKMWVEQLFNQQKNQLSWDQKITAGHIRFIVESLWQWLFDESFNRELYSDLWTQQKHSQAVITDIGQLDNEKLVTEIAEDNHWLVIMQLNQDNWTDSLWMIEDINNLLQSLPEQYTEEHCADTIQSISNAVGQLIVYIDENNLSSAESMTLNLLKHLVKEDVLWEKKYKILTDWRFTFVNTVTSLVKKKG